MPRLRHARLAMLAVLVTLVFALATTAFGDPARSPVRVADAAAARTPVPERPTRVEPWAPVPDPDGARCELAAPRPPSPAALTGYVWPIRNPRFTLGFQHTHWGSRVVDGKLFHDGIDLATFCGDKIYAAHDGVVLAAGRRYDRFMGWQGDLQPYFDRLDEKKAWLSLPIVVVIDDGNGYRSIYAHFSRVVVRPGERVEAGQLIGYEGATGRASGCHLHYGIFSPLETAVFEISPAVVKHLLVPRYQTARIDPLLVLPPMSPAPTARPAADPYPDGRPTTKVPEPSAALDE